MAVASIVAMRFRSLGILQAVAVETQVTLLGMGLFALALAALQKTQPEDE